MATNTFTALDKVTVGTATPSVTLSGISGAYTDLVLVMSATTAADGRDFRMQFNGDTTTNYSSTFLSGYTSATSGRSTSASYIQFTNLIGSSSVMPTAMIINIQNYANTTTYKTALIRSTQFQTNVNSGYSETMAQVGLWRKTPEAITSITILTNTGNINAGSTFSLYGIAASSVGAKATGGIISSDSQYYYHTFLSSGTFTPTQSLSCDYLVVAGGGGGGGYGGGGGAGGYKTSIGGSQLSVTATAYTITVGAGGAGGNYNGGSGGTAGSVGSNSIFSSVTSTGGGGGGTFAGSGTANNGIAGGSGGGAAGGARVTTFSGGAASPAGQGNAGGNVVDTNVGGGSGGAGGGGAGAAGNSVSSSSQGANGGAGLANSITGTSINYAGGGAGGNAGTATGGIGGGGNIDTAGTANTGGGGGASVASGQLGKAGGSGIVIVRYLK